MAVLPSNLGLKRTALDVFNTVLGNLFSKKAIKARENAIVTVEVEPVVWVIMVLDWAMVLLTVQIWLLLGTSSPLDTWILLRCGTGVALGGRDGPPLM